MSEIRLVERDYHIFREIDKWRVSLGRHIRIFAGFAGQRACDRRLRKLIDAGFITRKKILYGVPSIYANTHKAKALVQLPLRTEKIRIEQIGHDIAVADMAIYLDKTGIPFETMTTEKQLHISDGFGVRRHRPDIIFPYKGYKLCVEVELSLKAKDRMEKIIKENFREYDRQIWVVPDLKSKIADVLVQNQTAYPNIKIVELKEVKINE